MAFRKRNQPGCPCCTPAVCTTDFHVDECGSASAGATVVVKTGSGTTVASGTTNSSGDVSLNLAGYVGQTLYVTVTHNTTYFETANGVLLGNFCARRYAYQLAPKTFTYGTACGSISITTTRCDGTTLLGSKAWTLQKASADGWSTYTTGTTDATTAKSTVAGLTYGGAYDYYRFLVTDATGSVTGSNIILTATNCAASVIMRMATSISLPCTTPQDAITYSSGSSSTYVRTCCTVACSGVTMPPLLYVSDPSMNIDKTCNDATGGFTLTPVSGTATLIGNLCLWTQLDSSASNGRRPQSSYNLDLSNGTPVLNLQVFYNCSTTACQTWYGSNPYFCACQPPSGPGCCAFTAQYITNSFGSYWATICYLNYAITATSWTCNPFSATFTTPAIPLVRNGTVVYLPARTITITE